MRNLLGEEGRRCSRFSRGEHDQEAKAFGSQCGGPEINLITMLFTGYVLLTIQCKQCLLLVGT